MRRLFQPILLLFGSSLLLMIGLRLIVYDDSTDLEWLTIFEYERRNDEDFIRSINLFHPLSGATEEIAEIDIDLPSSTWTRWSADGEYLLLQHHNNDSHSPLYRLSRNTGRLEVVETLEPPLRLSALTAWSPDGWWGIAEHERPDGDYDLYVVKADGSTFRHVAEDLPLSSSDNYRLYAWASHGEWFIVASNRYDSSALFQVNLQPTDPIQLTSDERSFGALVLSPDDQQLFFSTGLTLYELDIATGQSNSITVWARYNTTTSVSSLYWATSGELVAAIQTRNQAFPIGEGPTTEDLLYRDDIYWLSFENNVWTTQHHIELGPPRDISLSPDGSNYAYLEHDLGTDSLVIGDSDVETNLGVTCDHSSSGLWWDDDGNLIVRCFQRSNRNFILVRILPDLSQEVVFDLSTIGDQPSGRFSYQIEHHPDWLFFLHQNADHQITDFEMVSIPHRTLAHYRATHDSVRPQMWIKLPTKPHNATLSLAIGGLFLITWIASHHRHVYRRLYRS